MKTNGKNGKKLTVREELRAFMLDPVTGKFKRGAKARVAELMHVTYVTLERWLDGRQPISQSREGELRVIMAANIDLSPKSTAPHCPRKPDTFYREQREKKKEAKTY